jgi:hypothetical protein
MEDIEACESEILKNILLLRKDIKKELERINSNTIDERVYYYNKLQSINVFQELFIIACKNREENLHHSFRKITQALIESCREYQPTEKSSCDVYMETYITFDKLIAKKLYS